jgi:DNA primase
MDFAQQLKASVDIVAVISEKVRLNKIGARYRGLCPFHQEKTPSFYVTPNLQFYKCFGCQAGGDVIRFVMEIDNLTFWEAVKLLAERNGIPLPKRSEHAEEDARRREALYQMNELAQKVFRASYLGSQGAAARAYVESRGVSPQAAEEFGLGFTERSGSLLAQKLAQQGFTPQQMEHSGLVLKRDSGGFFDRFRGRLMFPIHNEGGKLVGFAGRALSKDDEPKYLNSPETDLYQKQYLVYNLHRAKEHARKNQRIILVEGYMDVIGLWGGGIQEVVASCGTALTHNQVKLMKRHSDIVIVNFDPDAAGSNAAEKAIDIMLGEHAHIRMLELDQDLDPDEYIRKHGNKRYVELLARAPTYYHWLADRARKMFDVREAEGRTTALKFLLPKVHRIPDRIERAAVAADLASFLGVEPGVILEEFKRAAIDRREAARQKPAAPPALPPAEVLLLKALILHAGLRDELVERVAATQALERSRLSAVFRTLVQLHASQPDFAFSDFDARLEENDRSLLHRYILADEDHEADNLEAVRANALNCLRRLEADELEQRLAQLRQEVKEAQRQGDLESALRLMKELDRLKRNGS